MTNDSFRRRDEAARDRDEQSRDRDEEARDEEVISQRATRSARIVQTWATIVVIVMVAGLFYAINQRNTAIEELQVAAVRIERAATNTEQVLIEVVEAERSPEAIEQSQKVRQALGQIAVIRRLLCELPELADMPDCTP